MSLEYSGDEPSQFSVPTPTATKLATGGRSVDLSMAKFVHTSVLAFTTTPTIDRYSITPMSGSTPSFRPCLW